MATYRLMALSRERDKRSRESRAGRNGRGRRIERAGQVQKSAGKGGDGRQAERRRRQTETCRFGGQGARQTGQTCGQVEMGQRAFDAERRSRGGKGARKPGDETLDEWVNAPAAHAESTALDLPSASPRRAHVTPVFADDEARPRRNARRLLAPPLRPKQPRHRRS